MSSPLIINPSDLAALHDTKASEIYVILSRDRSTVLMDPGLGRPWSSRNRKLAEHHAKSYKGSTVATLTDAMAQIIKHPKNLPGRRN